VTLKYSAKLGLPSAGHGYWDNIALRANQGFTDQGPEPLQRRIEEGEFFSGRKAILRNAVGGRAAFSCGVARDAMFSQGGGSEICDRKSQRI
jgi:hypothetical protein